MPNLVGLSLQAAQQQPVVVKFRLALVAESIDSTSQPGTIVGQSVPAGQPVRAGTRVVVSVAVGGVTVPLVEGQRIEAAGPLLRKLGFGVEVSPTPTTRVRPGIISRQDPRAGTVRPRGSVVRLQVAEAIPVTPPNPNPPGDKPPDDITVPNLIGMAPDQAGPILSSMGLRARAQYLGLSRATPGAIVVEQDPRPGTRVRRGELVELVIAAREQPPRPLPQPPPTQFMPDLVGRTVESATADATVQQLRLRLTTLDDPMANGRPGVIVRQSVAASAPINTGSPVTVWVATGVVVPALVGLSADAASQQLGAKGLQARVSEVVRDRDAGNVVDQSPRSGVVVSRGAAVGLSVAVLAMVRVPDVGGRDRRDALSILTNSGLTGDVSNDDDSTLAPGTVSGQDPAPGAEVPPGAAVRVRVATGVTVPSVIGATSSDARARLTSTGLNVESREIRTDRSSANTVFQQVPGAGQRVARGTAVVVSVALPPLVTVPDVRGRQRGDAVGLLTAASLKNDVTNDPAAAIAPGLVSAQAPAPGSQVDVGTVVRLQLAVGVVVPSVIGISTNDAQARIASVGLRGNVREVRTEAARAGTVFQQSPVADERVARGSVVELSLARAPLVTVPDLAQRTRAEAESLARAAGLAVAFAEDASSTLPPDRVSRQEPAAGASVEVGETVRAVLATGVLVPPVVKMPIRSARSSLETSGLRVDERGEVNDGVPESTVLRQSPESNARVALGSLVRLVVAVRRTVTVPELVGRPRGEVEPLLAPIPLVASFEDAATADAGPVAGTVVQQVPAAGTIVGASTAVRVVLARTPALPDPDWRAYIFGNLTYFLGDLDLIRVMPWVAGIGLVSLLAYRFVNANRAGVEPPLRPVMDQEPPEPPPPAVPHVKLDPHVDEVTSRLEVSGPALIQFEVQIRTGTELSEQSLAVDGPLTGDERRLYE